VPQCLAILQKNQMATVVACSTTDQRKNEYRFFSAHVQHRL
jgi:hypothetical protein